MSFHEVRFPTNISRNGSLSVNRKTIISVADSGAEERNSPWANSRRTYNAGYGVKSLDDLYDIVSFFEERRGQLYGFRLKDPLDFNSTRPEQTPAFNNQVIGTGDGSTTAFNLVKTYGAGATAWVRRIRKPVSGTIKVGLNGVEQLAGWSVNSTTGVLSFNTAPANGVQITAGYEFDTPVRLGTDNLQLNMTDFETGVFPSIPIVEIPDSEFA